MGIIRGSHTSPGIYTKITDEKKGMNIRNNRKRILEAKSQPGSGGGGGKKPFEGLKFVALADNSTIGLEQRSTNQTVLEYSTDGENWVNFTTSVTVPLEHIGDEVHVRGKLTGNNTSDDYTQFTMSGRIAAIGNINYLWDYDNLSQSLYDYCGCYLFNDCTGLVNANELTLGTSATTLAYGCYGGMFYNCTSLTTAPELPATTLTNWCYRSMFAGCSSLTTAPELPATTLAYGCYQYMFDYCESLTTAPELPATTLVDRCYYYMFESCSSLTTAPELPATALADYCYSNMFNACSSLTTAPELPATTLTNWCYRSMFAGCSSLNYIKCLATSGIRQSGSTYNWVDGVASSGTFVKHPDATSWSACGNNDIPCDWVVEDAQIE